MASTIRVMELLNTPIKINDGKSSFADESFKGEVKFENVSFSYSNGTQVLKDISLEIPAKKTIALVGTTGSGKSSILKLLLRFYDVSVGKILVDNIDVKDLEQDELRSNIGYVSQDNYLFHGSVKDNISYGTFIATDEEITEAAKKAEAHDFIMSLPQGYETVIGERGEKLSGGQRQRLSIARAILKNPPLFIFDEATSAVDNETEAAIQRSLEQITKNATTLMVAHRLSTIKNADMIYVLENGSINQQGSHEQLVQEGYLSNALECSNWKQKK